VRHTVNARGQQGGTPEPPPLEDTLMSVFDQNKDGQVVMTEVSSIMEAFAAVGAGSSAGGDEKGEENDMLKMVKAAKGAAPTLFKLLDADSSKGLTKDELVWVSEADVRMNTKGLLKNVTKAVFDIFDGDADDKLQEAEIKEALDGEKFDQALLVLQDNFPIPILTAEVARTAVKENFKDGMAFMDADGNGEIARAEMYEAVKKVKKLFTKGVTIVRTMGPMLAMFGAMQ